MLFDGLFLKNADLVGGFSPSENYESVGAIISNIWRKKTYAKPPTS
jgi:hypothetical protein